MAGNKAAALARLRRAGFPVPPGVVVTAEALADVEAHGHFDNAHSCRARHDSLFGQRQG